MRARMSPEQNEAPIGVLKSTIAPTQKVRSEAHTQKDEAEEAQVDAAVLPAAGSLAR
jgi:hypothetical protein